MANSRNKTTNNYKYYTKYRHFELIVFLDRVRGNKCKELQNEHTSMEIQLDPYL